MQYCSAVVGTETETVIQVLQGTAMQMQQSMNELFVHTNNIFVPFLVCIQVAILMIRKAGIYALYVLFLLLLTYLLNQLDRYALAICTQPMAQDIGYGDKSCLALKNVTKNIIGDTKCADIKDPER